MDGCPVRVLDAQSGEKQGRRGINRRGATTGTSIGGHGRYGTSAPQEVVTGYDDMGGASKIFAKFFYEDADFAGFYYCPKAGAKERNAGLAVANHHPTVKPLKLVRYLQRLVTPPGGITASPFLGSGTDAVAAIMEGFNFWGMEISDEYWPIIEARVAEAKRKKEAEMSRPVVQQARLSL